MGRLTVSAATTAVGLGLITFTAPRSAAQDSGIPDNPRLRWEHFYQQRAYPFDRIPRGALQRARAELRTMTTGGAFRQVPPPIDGTDWTPIGPEGIPINLTSIGRLSTIAVHPTNSNIIYIGGAQGGVWKTTDGGANWTPLTDGECSLAMGWIAIDPVDPQIIYAGTGEQHFSGDSYYGCGLLRSEDGGATWTQLGASIFDGTGGARISRVVIDPTTAGNAATTTVLIASDRGLYRSTDGGVNWNQVQTGIATDLVIDPVNTNILYAGFWTSNVRKSIDGGVNWIPMVTGFPVNSVGRINLAISPSDPNVLYASVHNISNSQLLGIWKSTDASTWSQLGASGASCGSQCWYDMHIAVHPADPDTVYFGGVTLYRSNDGGQSFFDIRGPIHVDQHAWAFDPQDPNIVYAGNDGGVFRSDNGGTTWNTLNTNLALTQFYAGISLHPTDPAIVLGGTQDNGTLQYMGMPNWLHVLGGDGGFTAIDFREPTTRYAETQWGGSFSGPRRSDGGAFIQKVNGISFTDPAQFIPPLVMSPIDPRTLYFGTRQLYRTTDRAEQWTAIKPNLGEDITAIAPAASDPEVIYVGTEGGSVDLTTDGGVTWNAITSGLPNRFVKDIAVDPFDWETAILTVSGFGTGHVFRTTDGGTTWNDISGNLPDVPVNAVVVDPGTRANAIIGTDLGVFATADSGGTWTPLTTGMPNVAVFDLAYNPGTGVLIAATHGRGMFQLILNRPLTLAVSPRSRLDSVMEGSTTQQDDSATVLLTGTNANSTVWSASHGGATWITLNTTGMTGPGIVSWTRDPTGLAAGTYVDTITVTAGGAADSPQLIFDTLLVQTPLTLALSTASRAVSVEGGSETPIPDSADVLLSGVGAEGTGWSASHGAAAWLSLTNANGTGTGKLTWTRDPTDLTAGIYVDTIEVAAPGAVGSPTQMIDSLIILQPAFSVAPRSRRVTALGGSIEPILDSVEVVLLDDTATWSASHGSAPWVTLTNSSATGSGKLRWTRNPSGLRVGVHVDTITVTASIGETQSLVDSLVIEAPAVGILCSGQQLVGALECLSELEIRYLDLEGNRDGVYNLGDWVALLSRGTQPPPTERRQ